MALLRHSGIYLVARILAGAASFAVIAAYTRLLSAHEFGELALALAGIGFFGSLTVYGTMATMLRFLPGDSNAARATTLWGAILPATVICAAAGAMFLLAAPEPRRWVLAASAGLLLVTLLHQFQLATAQGALRPERYALFVSLESMLEMLLGIGLVLLGYGVVGALLGSMIAVLTAVVVNWRGWWISWKFFNPLLGRQMLRFGLPLLLTALFSWLATFADRWLLGAYLGADRAGLYAAGYDLQLNLLGVPLTVMTLAGVPLTVSALAERGVTAAKHQLRLQGTLALLIVLPEIVGIVMTGPLLVNVFLGPEFRPLALSLLPILVGAMFFKVLISYMTQGYFLAARTDLTLLSIAAAAAINLVLNLILIPRYGPPGSAVAALVAFAAGFAIAATMMRNVFAFPLPDPAVFVAAALGGAAMAAWLLPFLHVTALSTALYVIPVAVLIYFGVVFLFLHFTGRKPYELMRGLWASQRSEGAAI